VYNLGCDYCGPLVEIARKRGEEVLVCDNLNLPFRDQCFNAVISIGGKTAYTHSVSLQIHIAFDHFLSECLQLNLFSKSSPRITTRITEINVVKVKKKIGPLQRWAVDQGNMWIFFFLICDLNHSVKKRFPSNMHFKQVKIDIES